MKGQKRKYCHYCSGHLALKMEGDTIRDYCPSCNLYFYENPLPVVSSILVQDRKVLLVKRANRPCQGQWCLPSGFAESGESVAEAALRELKEETGVRGRVLRLQDVDSSANSYYGDLLFLTFEVEQIGGTLMAGDDAEAARYFSIDRVPELAFSSNTKALQSYIDQKKDYWAIVDSFSLAAGSGKQKEKKDNLLSNILVAFIEEHSDRIAGLWMEDVKSNRTTPTFHTYDQEILYHRVFLVISHLGQWLAGSYRGQDIASYYQNLGRTRKEEGFALSEIVSALGLIHKHIWEFALSSGIWSRAIDIYMILEMERRISIFFHRATYYTSLGYEK